MLRRISAVTIMHIADEAEFTPRNVQTAEGRATTVLPSNSPCRMRTANSSPVCPRMLTLSNEEPAKKTLQQR